MRIIRESRILVVFCVMAVVIQRTAGQVGDEETSDPFKRYNDTVCPLKPCKNAGNCDFNRQVGSYTCHCQCGYTGENCTITPKPCDPKVCHGKCATATRLRRADGESCEFTTCECTQKWIRGRNCQYDMNACWFNGTFCGNKGSCHKNDGGGFSCKCRKGRTGSHCQDKDEGKLPEAEGSLAVTLVMITIVSIIIAAASFLIKFCVKGENPTNGQFMPVPTSDVLDANAESDGGNDHEVGLEMSAAEISCDQEE